MWVWGGHYEWPRSPNKVLCLSKYPASFLHDCVSVLKVFLLDLAALDIGKMLCTWPRVECWRVGGELGGWKGVGRHPRQKNCFHVNTIKAAHVVVTLGKKDT